MWLLLWSFDQFRGKFIGKIVVWLVYVKNKYTADKPHTGSHDCHREIWIFHSMCSITLDWKSVWVSDKLNYIECSSRGPMQSFIILEWFFKHSTSSSYCSLLRKLFCIFPFPDPISFEYRTAVWTIFDIFRGLMGTAVPRKQGSKQIFYFLYIGR